MVTDRKQTKGPRRPAASAQGEGNGPAGRRPRSLVTGACGFMGSHMVELLHQAGHEVIATDLQSCWGEDDRKRGRFPSVVRELGVEFRPSDMRSPRTLAPLVEGLDYVFHIASIFSYSVPWEALYQVNVAGTRHLLDLLVERTPDLKRLVLWGAGGVYGLPSHRPGPFTEDLPPAPTNDYLRSKWFQEHLVMEYGRKHGLPYAIMRPTTVYGPRCVYGAGQLFMGPAQMKLVAAPRNFTAHIPFVHVRDVVGAALHLAQSDAARGEVFNLNDDTLMDNVEFFRYVAEVTNRPFLALPPVPVRFVKTTLTAVANVMRFASDHVIKFAPPLEAGPIQYFGEDFRYSNDKLKGTGYRFVYPDARKGIRETLEWYRDQGWIEY